MALRSEQALLAQCIKGELEFHVGKLPTTPSAQPVGRGPSRVDPWPECADEVVAFMQQADRTSPTFEKYPVRFSNEAVRATFNESGAKTVAIDAVRYLAALSHDLSRGMPFAFSSEFEFQHEGTAMRYRPDFVVLTYQEDRAAEPRVLVVGECRRAGYFEEFKGLGSDASMLPDLVAMYNHKLHPSPHWNHSPPYLYPGAIARPCQRGFGCKCSM